MPLGMAEDSEKRLHFLVFGGYSYPDSFCRTMVFSTSLSRFEEDSAFSALHAGAECDTLIQADRFYQNIWFEVPVEACTELLAEATMARVQPSDRLVGVVGMSALHIVNVTSRQALASDKNKGYYNVAENM